MTPPPPSRPDDASSAGPASPGPLPRAGRAGVEPAALVFALAAGALALWLFFPILALRWRFYDEQPRYSHCPLLPLVSLAWIWDRREVLRGIPRAPSGVGTAAAAAAVALFVHGRVVSSVPLQHGALLLAVAAGVWAWAGARLTRALAFPLGYLLLTMPLAKAWDDALTQPLQRIATVVAETVFDAFGWVVVRQGNVLHLPGLKLLVEDACSGIHSLYSLVALAVAWVAFVPRPAWLRVTLVVSALPIAIVANALRVIATGVLAYKVDPGYAAGTSHTVAGMLVFAVGLGLFLLLDWCLRPDDDEEAA